MQTNIKLAVCYFMPEKNYLKNDYCIPIQLGPEETGLDLGIEKDNHGDNRSEKHPYYSEYSGIYWLWKNTKAEYKGMLHHRRCMTEENVSVGSIIKHISKSIIYEPINVFSHKPYTYQRVVNCNSDEQYYAKVNTFIKNLPLLLKRGNYDIVVPKRYLYYHTNVKEAFDEVVTRAIQKCLDNIFETKYPQFKKYYHSTLHSRKLYYSNIHIMKNNCFEEFCRFTFGVFDCLEKSLIEGEYYQDLSKEKSMSRVFGYIGELMMNTYILSAIDKGCKVKELTLIFNKSAKGNENIDYKSMRYYRDIE